MRPARTVTITKVTPKWVRSNGVARPEDETTKGGVIYDTPLGAFRIDTADRVASVDEKK